MGKEEVSTRISLAVSRIADAVRYRLYGFLGRILTHEDASGHMLLCRLIHPLVHYGPHGTFCRVDSRRLEHGGHICIYGVECGSPTESYMRQHNERSEAVMRAMDMCMKLGIVETNVWSNPRFSAEGLCACGKSDDPQLPHHDPLCPYRVEHGYEVTIAEYKAALGQRIQ